MIYTVDDPSVDDLSVHYLNDLSVHDLDDVGDLDDLQICSTCALFGPNFSDEIERELFAAQFQVGEHRRTSSVMLVAAQKREKSMYLYLVGIKYIGGETRKTIEQKLKPNKKKVENTKEDRKKKQNRK